MNGAKIIAILPVGTVLRIDRFMVDHGIGSDDEVKATLLNGNYAQKTVNVDALLLTKIIFLWPGGQSSSTNWDVDTEMLGKP